MKKVIVIMVVMLVTVFVTGCFSAGTEAEKKMLEMEKNQQIANSLVSILLYVKDPRTNSCFAFMSSRSSSLAWAVTCDTIQKDILVTANVK